MQKQVQNILVMPLLPSVHSTISLTLTSDPIKWRVCGYFEAPLVWTASGYAVHNHTIYHIHICHFLHRQNFWRIKFTPKFTQKIANLHSTLPIFRVKSVKIYTVQKKFTRAPPVAPVTNMRYVHNQTKMQKSVILKCSILKYIFANILKHIFANILKHIFANIPETHLCKYI